MLNPNIPLQAGQGVTQPINLLAAAGQAQQFQQNQLALQQTRAQQAIGQAVQQSTDPTTGAFDAASFRARVASDPNAAFGASDAITTSQNQQAQQYGLAKDQLGQQTERAGVFSSALAPLLANPNPQPSDVFGVVARLSAAGIPVSDAVNQLSTMPQQGGSALHQWLQNNVGSTMAPDAFLPKPTYVSTGGTTQAVDSNPLTNPSAASTTLSNTLSPGEQVSPTAGPLAPGGGRTVVPTAAYAASHGLGNLIPGNGRAPLPSSLVGPGGMPGAAPVAGVGAGPGASGGSPPAPASGGSSPFGEWGGASPGVAVAQSTGAVGAGPAAGATSALPYGAPMQTTLGPGQEAGLASAGNESAKQWAALQAQVGGTSAGGGSAGRIYQLQKSLGLLQQLGPQGTGPSAQASQQLMSYVRSLPVIGAGINNLSSPQNVTSYDEANKYLTAYAAARAGAHGGTTDSQLATTLSSNASTHISNLAAQDVVRANIGLERMDQAQSQAFQQSGQTPDQFANFSANWNKTMDPRAFVAPELTPQQFSTMIGGMSPSDRTKFQSTYNSGISNGWLTPPAWAQGGSASAPVAAPSGGVASGY